MTSISPMLSRGRTERPVGFLAVRRFVPLDAGGAERRGTDSKRVRRTVIALVGLEIMIMSGVATLSLVAIHEYRRVRGDVGLDLEHFYHVVSTIPNENGGYLKVGGLFGTLSNRLNEISGVTVGASAFWRSERGPFQDLVQVWGQSNPINMNVQGVGPSYFRSLGLKMVSGSDFANIRTRRGERASAAIPKEMAELAHGELPHQLFDAVRDGVSPDPIPPQVRVEAVGHDLGGQRSVGRKELIADVHEEHLFVVCQFRKLAVDVFDGRAVRIGCLWSARKDSQQQHLGLWMALLEFLDDQSIAVHDLVIGIAIDVVRAKHQHDELCFERVQFAVLHPPQHALSCVAADSEVGGLQRSEVLIPDRLSRIPPSIGDRIAHEKQLDRRAAGNLDKGFVPVVVTRQGDVGWRRRPCRSATAEGSSWSGHTRTTLTGRRRGSAGLLGGSPHWYEQNENHKR